VSRPGQALLADHFLLLVILATLLAGFLALLFRDEPAARKRMFGRLWLALVGGAVAVAWLLRAVAA
jgi:hypothetical protein